MRVSRMSNDRRLLTRCAISVGILITLVSMLALAKFVLVQASVALFHMN